MDIEAPQDAVTRKGAKRLDALSAMASDIGAGFAQMQASAAEAKAGARVHQKKAVEPEPEPGLYVASNLYVACHDRISVLIRYGRCLYCIDRNRWSVWSALYM